jgi:toxin ParE1/3/4
LGITPLLDYIGANSPHDAQKVKARVQDMIKLVLQYPHAGTKTRRKGYRRLVAHPYPYLIFYEPHEDEIIIHAIRHTARKPSTPG